LIGEVRATMKVERISPVSKLLLSLLAAVALALPLSSQAQTAPADAPTGMNAPGNASAPDKAKHKKKKKKHKKKKHHKAKPV
jgi:Ni/Co efflux regulator RcnB